MKALVIFGSKSDEKCFNKIVDGLKKENVEFDLKISSAHKTPEDVDQILKEEYGLIIAGAGLAAHLPGVVASKVIVPVIGVPALGSYEGLDALLSIAQMPPGIPVLSVGVDKGEVAAVSAAKIINHDFEYVNIIGDKENKAVKKAVTVLEKMNVPLKFSDSIVKEAVNIAFVYFDEPIEQKDELVIYCPLMMEKDDKAESALNFLKHSNHGLWVGTNNGVNAAIAAVEILNKKGAYEEMLRIYRNEMKEKIFKDNKELNV